MSRIVHLQYYRHSFEMVMFIKSPKNVFFRIACVLYGIILSVNVFAQGQITRRPSTQNVNGKKRISTQQKESRNTLGRNTKVRLKKDYVDLGLPSGTLWKKSNEEELYGYDFAMNKYGNSVPSKEQWIELKECCKWTWNGNSYTVEGNNRKSIVLPAAGYRDSYSGSVFNVGSTGYYWSSYPIFPDEACCFYFNSSENGYFDNKRGYGLSVRLVLMEDH